MSEESRELSALGKVSRKIYSYMALKLVLTTCIMVLVILTLYYFRDTTHLAERFSVKVRENVIITTLSSTLIISLLMTISVPIEPILISMAYFISRVNGPTIEVFLSLLICFNATQISTFLTVILVRYYIIEYVKEKVLQYTLFSALNEIAKERGTLLVVLTRLSLFLPFVTSNCLLGLTEISFWNLFIGNFAVIPAQIALIIFGAFIYNSHPHHEFYIYYTHPKYAVLFLLSAMASLMLLIYMIYQKYLEIKNETEFLPGEESLIPSSVPFRQVDF